MEVVLTFIQEMAAPGDIFSSFIAIIPYWIAAVAGLLIGWSWRPRWAAALIFLAANNRSRFVWVPPGFGARRFWFALSALSAFSFLNRIFRKFKASAKSGQNSSNLESSTHDVVERSSVSDEDNETQHVTEADLGTLMSYIEERDGGPPWQFLMERSTGMLTYQAWRRDPEIGPTQYRTKTVFENATPELLRDFFWDDEFRTTWDDMLIYFRTLKEYPRTGTMVVHWIRKFPFFCSDREYIIIRRIWESNSSYYCITKGTPYPALQRHKRLRRVDLYYSSWYIKPVKSNGGHLTATEVLLFHQEDMGIPRELAKIGMQRGVWGFVKKMDTGLRVYQMARVNGIPLSQHSRMAHITTSIPSSTRFAIPDLEADDTEEERLQRQIEACQKSMPRRNVVTWLVVGGVLILCGICGGAIGKGVLSEIARGSGRGSKKNNRRENRLISLTRGNTRSNVHETLD